ncbi:hypothetical protein T03_9783 [Trichinella britovi]|uniref:Uncharacterized protein n=1 Tax=Trichinella britovi TaxID=45882 RepID=A0A0V1CY60_TRIBR|nr:hypothetical protein T03_9783 [Trichinella britovi]
MECGRAEIQHWMIGKGIDVRVHNSEWLLDELMLEGRRSYSPLLSRDACCGGKVHLSDCMCIQLVVDGGCRVCVAKGCTLYTELKDLLITRDEKWFIITEGKEQNSAATQRHNELRERFATPPIATIGVATHNSAKVVEEQRAAIALRLCIQNVVRRCTTVNWCQTGFRREQRTYGVPEGGRNRQHYEWMVNGL